MPPPTQAAPTTLASSTETGVVAAFFRALGDPTRLRLLEYLLHDEHTVSDCVHHVGLSQGRVSVHLACLADCGYIQARRQGRWCHYRVTDPRVAQLVTLARSLATDNGAALATCTRIDATRPSPAHPPGTRQQRHAQEAPVPSPTPGRNTEHRPVKMATHSRPTGTPPQPQDHP